MTEHWHVRRHAEDDDVYVGDDVFDALQHAGEELERIADFEHDGVTSHGEAEMFEEAYRCYVRWQRFANLAENASQLWNQYRSPHMRAPLYQGPKDQAEAKLTEAAMHQVERINDGGPKDFRMWSCTEDCEREDVDV